MDNNINRFLWLSDVHFRASYNETFNTQEETQTFISSFKESINKYLTESNSDFDYIILSGDIAFSGSEKDYEAFNNHILEPLLQEIESIQIDRLQKWLQIQEYDSTIKTQCNNKFRKKNELKKESLIESLLDFFTDDKYEYITAYINQVKSKNTKIICCPGNHDIQRNKYPDEWKTKDKNDKIKLQKFEDRNKFLGEENENVKSFKQSFKQQFEGYQDFFKGKIGKSLNNSGLKTNNGLFGGYVDHNIKVKFFVINSAWYCINAQEGKIHKENLLEKISTQPVVQDDIQESIEELIEILSASNEFGGLIVGQDIIEKEINEIIGTNPKYPLIVIVHHPQWWWYWGELNSYKGSYRPVQKLLDKCDILLTGHEHLPVNTPWKKINEDSQKDSYQLMAGMFLEDNIDSSTNYGEDIFPHNRFSIIELNRKTDILELKEIRFLFDHKVWGKRDNPIVKTLDLLNTILCDEEQKSSIKKFFTDDDKIINKIKDYFIEEYNLTIEYVIDSKKSFTKYSVQYFIFNDLKSIPNSQWLIVVPTKGNFHTDIISNPDFIQNLKEQIKPLDSSKLYVSFFCLDILSGDGEQYNEKHTDGEVKVISDTKKINDIFLRIADEADFAFNKFKYDFFKEYENNESVSEPFTKFHEISFVNIVPPYWIIQKSL